MVVVQGVFFRYLMLSFNRDKITRILNISRELWNHLSNIEETETVRRFERRAYQFRNFILTNTLMICTTFYATFFILTASIPKDQKPLVFKFVYYQFYFNNNSYPSILYLKKILNPDFLWKFTPNLGTPQ